MHLELPTPVLVLCLACSAAAQNIPDSMTLTRSYSQAALGLGAGLGGIDFNPTGTVLYVNDRSGKHVVALTVQRNANNVITGFSPPTGSYYASNSLGTLEGGLCFSRLGTMFALNYAPPDLEQYSSTTQGTQLTDLNSVGLVGDCGGAEFIPVIGSKPERLLVGNYDNGGIFEVPLTLQANLTFAIGTISATPWLRTPAGMEGFAFVKTGPFGQGRGLLLTNYDNGDIMLVGIDPTTGDPFKDANGNAKFVPFMTNMGRPMDVEFDPVTNDLFVTDYDSPTDAIRQYSGVVGGGLDGSFDIYGPGCPQANTLVPTLNTLGSKLVSGQPITIYLVQGPPNSTIGGLVFGVGATGNAGGFLLTGSCRVHVNDMLAIPFPTNSGGLGSVTFTIPASAKGFSVFMQAWAFSNGANALNLTVSDAAVSIIK